MVPLQIVFWCALLQKEKEKKRENQEINYKQWMTKLETTNTTISLLGTQQYMTTLLVAEWLVTGVFTCMTLGFLFIVEMDGEAGTSRFLTYLENLVVF